VFCSDGTVAGTGCKTLACAMAKSWYTASFEQICLAANGPAIKGGCVTWRSHPGSGPGTLGRKLSRWQDRYGVLFAVRVQVLLRAGAVAVQV